MFDIGFSEILLLAIMALLVLGPERLPKAARLLGASLRKAKASWHSVKAELEEEIAQSELKETLKNTSEELRKAGKDFDTVTRKDLLNPVNQAVGDTRKAVNSAKSSAKFSNEVLKADTAARTAAAAKAAREAAAARAAAAAASAPAAVAAAETADPPSNPGESTNDDQAT